MGSTPWCRWSRWQLTLTYEVQRRPITGSFGTTICSCHPGCPRRVRDLAEQITSRANTPIDKALLVQDHLRGPAYEYSQDIDAPPPEADGVDHFLFETRIGYSDYFASAMAVPATLRGSSHPPGRGLRSRGGIRSGRAEVREGYRQPRLGPGLFPQIRLDRLRAHAQLGPCITEGWPTRWKRS